MKLLIDHITTAYAPMTQRLDTLEEEGLITYDLLWALFKPNNLVFTKCSDTRKPRCVRFDFGEERTTGFGENYYHLEGRYLDFDGKVFGKLAIRLKIGKFRGTKHINALEVFPLQYHSDEAGARTYLDKCGRRFLSPAGAHHREYDGPAFIMAEGRPVTVPVTGRVMVDPAYFHEANPNYKRPSLSLEKNSLGDMDSDDDDPNPNDSIRSIGLQPTEVAGDDVLICSPTVFGYSLDQKL